MLSSIFMAAAALLVVGAFFLGTLGIYESFVKRFAEEVGEQKHGGGLVGAIRSVALKRLGVVNRRFISPKYEADIRRKLITAGEPADLKPEEFLGLQELGAVAFLLFGIILLNFFGVAIYWAVLFGVGGWYYPKMWLGDQIKKRHLQIIRSMPYNLDLLTLSVEAGLDFAAALAKVVEKGKKGAFNDECALVLKQLKMGKTREEALKMMVARVNLPALTTFVTALIQADKMGTSLGKVLRIQSTQLRIERTQRAEKLANEAPVKMLFPLVLCIFPCVFMILFGPIVFQFMYGDAIPK